MRKTDQELMWEVLLEYSNNAQQPEEKINIINSVLHYYNDYRSEGDRIVERIVTAMTEDGVVGEEYDEVIDDVVTHMVEVIKLMKL